ncbi:MULTISPECIES: P1 family peptidase [Mesorhizobium]|uniref:S58 family peptidase n=1 Tax=Mesorhizobium denitrificans TaxID=2294114 RepID=A0A371X753_9HYPH|nr:MULTISPECIES: P1 family peptidase [Mesorhizobium]RFC64874.1 S58 family peptidase [Mesorhizobium denitrificans]
MKVGPLNLITDVQGIRVGNSEDAKLKSGVSVVICDVPTVASVQVLGGAPGTRETDLLEPHNTVENIDAIVLSGGSAFGLDAASGAQAALREAGVGFAVGDMRIPIVPTAILFDLLNGGDKNWGRFAPYREMGYEAVKSAGRKFLLGTSGAGAGALTVGLKGGLGSASCVMDNGITIGALAAVNAVGSANIGKTRHFWAAPFEIDDEFGGLGMPHPMPNDATAIRLKFRDEKPLKNTTIAVIATDAVLTKASAKRLAISAHDGFARAIWPSHTPFDGDLVFGLATGASGKELQPESVIDFYATAAAVMTRAIARGVYAAEPSPGDLFPCWSALP